MADADKSRSARRLGRKSSPKPRKNAMSESKTGTDSIFEVGRIRRLVELMKEHDLSERDLRESRQRIRICRGPKDAPRLAYAAPPPPPPSSASGNTAGLSSAAPKSAAESANIALVKS